MRTILSWSLLERLRILDYFNALGLIVCKLSFEGFHVARMLCFEKISFKKIIFMEDIGLMTFCYILEGFMSLRDFALTKLV